MWHKCGGGKMMTEMVDACLAVCCRLIETGLSIDSLLNCVLHLVLYPPKACTCTCISW